MSHAPIAYIYEADFHCPVCARKRFGRAVDDPDTEDSEGNPLGALSPWDETSPEGEYCGDCGEEIAEPYGDDEDDVPDDSYTHDPEGDDVPVLAPPLAVTQSDGGRAR